jgi:hypothetical protein
MRDPSLSDNMSRTPAHVPSEASRRDRTTAALCARDRDAVTPISGSSRHNRTMAQSFHSHSAWTCRALKLPPRPVRTTKRTNVVAIVLGPSGQQAASANLAHHALRVTLERLPNSAPRAGWRDQKYGLATLSNLQRTLAAPPCGMGRNPSASRRLAEHRPNAEMAPFSRAVCCNWKGAGTT